MRQECARGVLVSRVAGAVGWRGDLHLMEGDLLWLRCPSCAVSAFLGSWSSYFSGIWYCIVLDYM